MPTAAMLDDLPKGAWIAMMVIGFIVFWPIGLALLFYMIWSGKMQGWKRDGLHGCASQFRSHRRSSGNTAFDSYRDDMLKKLEEEQKAFGEFMERLRRAKDQQEFDQFMNERRAGETPN
ncbi:MAG: DUF2852 domain-containing protein [Parvibaculaceae bacterium]|nr:DUF2852 domain-containing protein [Parvibaculaceae bacterium]